MLLMMNGFPLHCRRGHMDKPDTTVPYVIIVLLKVTSRLESDKLKFTWTISWNNDDQSSESLEEVSAILQTIALDVNLQEEDKSFKQLLAEVSNYPGTLKRVKMPLQMGWNLLHHKRRVIV